MRHAAVRTTPGHHLSRGAQIALGAVAYAAAAAAIGLITLGSTLALWGLWQWLGVN